jgi:hypothetical protein
VDEACKVGSVVDVGAEVGAGVSVSAIAICCVAGVVVGGKFA